MRVRYISPARSRCCGSSPVAAAHRQPVILPHNRACDDIYLREVPSRQLSYYSELLVILWPKNAAEAYYSNSFETTCATPLK